MGIPNSEHFFQISFREVTLQYQLFTLDIQYHPSGQGKCPGLRIICNNWLICD